MKKAARLSFLLIFSLNSMSLFGQIKTPPASPVGTINQQIGLMEASITYSRPSKKDRDIFGGLLPYGELWRAGANAATKVTFSDQVKVAGEDVPAGTYSLFMIPEQGEWTVILNKNTELWGVDGYQQTEDLLRVNIKPVSNPLAVETLTYAFSDLHYNSAHLTMKWDHTMIKIPIETDVDSQVLAAIEKTMQGSPNPGDYYQAASFYFNTERDTEQALTWITQAIDGFEKENRNVFWVYHMKANMLAELKRYKEAIEMAEISIEKAQEANNVDYVRLNENKIREWKEQV